jgi:lactoylglutathione lyase
MLHFEGGCTLEIMSRTDVDQVRNSEDREFIGFAHLAFSTGSKDQVDRLTERLRQARSSVNPAQPETVFTKV